MRKFFRKILTSLALAISLPAMAGSYTAITNTTVTNTYPWVEIAPLASGCASTGTYQKLANNQTTSLTLPFAFNFAGTNYSGLTLSANGFITFSGSINNGNAPIALALETSATGSFPLWADLDPPTANNPSYSSTTGSCPGIYYATTGTAPNRKFIIEYKDVPLKSVNNSNNTFQIQLNEQNSVMVFRYQNVYNNGSSAIIGQVANITAPSDYTEYSNKTASVSNGFAIAWNVPPVNHYEVEFTPNNTSAKTGVDQQMNIRACFTATSPCINATDKSTISTTLALTTDLGTFGSNSTANSSLIFTGATTDTLNTTVAGTATITTTNLLPLKCYSGSTLLASCTVTFAPTIDHYEIEFSPSNTSGLTCMPQPIKVRSCSTTASPCTNTADQSTSPSTLGLTTSLGKFISSGTSTTNLGVTGNTTDSLSVTTVGTTTITAGGSIPLKCYSGSTLLGSCTSTFSNSGIFFDWQTNQQVGGDGVVIAGNTSNVVKLSALKSDKTNACVGFQPTSGTVNLNLSYADPISGTQAINVTPTNSVGTGTSGTVAIGTGATGVNFVWDANGNTYLTTKYVDAGKVTLNASISAGSTYPAMSTSTNLISKPYMISAYKNATDVTCANGTIFSGTSSNKFCPAGEVFTTKVRAFAADGLTTLPNFGKESAASTLVMQGSLISGANAGNIKNEASGTSSVLTTGVNFTPTGQVCSAGDCYYPMNFSWDNVGEINLTPSVSGDNYFGSGSIAVKSILPVGRFYPFGFSYTTSNIINRPTCSPTPNFTYMGENFNAIVTLSAINKAGVVTNNYDGSKFPANNTGLWNLKAIAGTTLLNSRIVLVSSAGTWSNGVLSASLTANLSRTTNPDGTYNVSLGIAPIDTDGVSFAQSSYDLDTDNNSINDAKNIGATNIYFGRMKIVGNVGSELIKMPLPVVVQKYVNNGFITNTDDSCTKINNTNITKSNFTGTLSSANVVISSPTTSATMINGQQTIVVAAPGGSNNGAADIGYDVNGTSQSYLAGNWGVSTYDQNPKGKVVFSRQQAKKKLIFTNQNF